MSESIGVSAFDFNAARPFSVSDGGGVSVGVSSSVSSLLDIHRDFAAVQENSVSKITEKVTPDKTFSLDEKRRWKREQNKTLYIRENVARSIVLDYVNGVAGLYSDLPPMAAAAAEEEEKMVRQSQCRSFLKCLRKNNHAPVDLVKYDDGSVMVSGVWRCGSLWQCPRCASVGLWRYSRRLCDLLSAIQSENKKRREEGVPCVSVLFCTFTAPHSPGDGLGEEMRLFSDVWHKVMNARAVRSIKEEYGLVGSVRCYDHTVTLYNDGLKDWHTHFHNLLIFDPMEGNGVELVDRSSDLADVSDVLYSTWENRVLKYTGRRCSQKAFKVELVSLYSDEHSESAVADYAAKVFVLPGYMTKSQKMRNGEEEDGLFPPFRSLAPFDLLDAYNVWGDCGYDYAGAWIEYCVETKGFHRVHFSKGLEARFGIERKKRSEKEACPVCRHTLPGAVADVALRNVDVLDGLKEAITSDDVVLFWDVLEPLGLGWAADDVADEKPMEAPLMSDAERAGEHYRLMRERGLAGLLAGWDGVKDEKKESLFFGGVENEE